MLRQACVLLFVFLLFDSVTAFAAQQPVEMIPQRIILEGRERSTVLTLLNRNPEAVTYRIETFVMRQALSGGIGRVSDPTSEEQQILKMIRFSPRRVRIPANNIQIVRIMARKPANLPAGEYRAHIRVTPVPGPKKISGTSAGVAIQLDLIISLSIPIIIRHGETHVALGASGAAIEHKSDGTKKLKVRITAEGNRSVFMDAEIYHGDTLLGENKGFAIYQPNGQRDVVFPLKAKLPPSCTVLRLILRDREKDDIPLIREIPIVMQ